MSYAENFNSKLDWAMPFQRTGQFPLDRTGLFSSYADAVAYAKGDGSDSRQLGGTSYVGQIIVVIENGQVDAYKINADRTISPINNASSGDKTYVHYQDSPAKTWTIVHNLNKFPSVTTVDSANTTVIGVVQYIDTTSLTVNFNAAFSGKATLN